MFLEVKCSWCEKFMGKKDADQDSEPLFPITDIICPDCMPKLLEQIQILPQQKLENFESNLVYVGDEVQECA